MTKPLMAARSRHQGRSPSDITRFFAGPSAGVFGIFVARGAVTVSAAGTEVVVHAGEGTNIAQPGAAPSAPTPWGAERVRNAMQSVQ